jgi:hypothetical protein
MNFNDIKTAFHFSSNTLREGFSESLARRAEAAHFLSENFIRATAATLAMSQEGVSVLIAGRSLFQDKLAAALFHHCRQRFAAGESESMLYSWEQLPATYHEAAGPSRVRFYEYPSFCM